VSNLQGGLSPFAGLAGGPNRTTIAETDMKRGRFIKALALVAGAGVPLITSVTCDPYTGLDFYRDDDYGDYYYDGYDDYYYGDCFWFCF